MQHTDILVYENVRADIYTLMTAKKYGEKFEYAEWPVYTEKEFGIYLYERGFDIIPLLANPTTIDKIKKNYKDSIVYTSPKLYKHLSSYLKEHKRRGLIKHGYFQYVLPDIEDPKRFDYYVSNAITKSDRIGDKKFIDYGAIYDYNNYVFNYERRIFDNVTKCNIDAEILEAVIKNPRLFNEYIKKGFTNSNYSDVVFCLNKMYFTFNADSNKDIERGRKTILETMKVLETGADNISGEVFTSDIIHEIFKNGSYDEIAKHEFLVGVLATNKLRRYIPNFAMIYGLFSCDIKKDKDRIFLDCEEKSNGNILAYEQVINSESLFDFCKRSTTEDVYKIVIQMVLSLSLAYEKYGFLHRDLHGNNVLVKHLDEPITIKYNINDEDVYITTKTIPVIIDYGSSLIKHDGIILAEVLDNLQNEAIYFPMRDIVVLLNSVIYSSPENYKLLKFFADINSIDDAAEYLSKIRVSSYKLPLFEKYLCQTYGDYFLFMKQELPLLFSDFVKSNNEGEEIFGCANSFCETPKV